MTRESIKPDNDSTTGLTGRKMSTVLLSLTLLPLSETARLVAQKDTEPDKAESDE